MTNTDYCVIFGCKSPGPPADYEDANYYLCPRHDAQWGESGERTRAYDGFERGGDGFEAMWFVAFNDWVRRINAENQNAGNGYVTTG